MKKLVLLMCLLAASCQPKVDCVKIGMSYEEVVKSCGKPHRHTYRANHLDQVKYRSGFVIGFSREEKVNFYHYKSASMEKIEYAEDVE